MADSLRPVLPRSEIHTRLQDIFPEGSPNRNYCTREMAASVVFTLLYIGAVDGSNRYAAPKHIYRMSDEQAALVSDADRIDYGQSIAKAGALPLGQAWYADNTREPIRDETIRNGFAPVGAITEIPRPTTSPKGRYALASDFADLFSPSLTGEDFDQAVSEWRAAHLTAAELARVRLILSGADPNPESFLVTFPNGETQHLTPGNSSVIAKGIIEQFAPRFLEKPHVVWVSESGNKVVSRHDLHAHSLGLNLNVEKVLPDIILVDMAKMVIVFVEVVSTDGPVNSKRREELLKLVTDAGHSEKNAAFVSAFLSRDAALKKVLPDLAWNSFVWIASEPDALITLEREETVAFLHERLAETG